MIDPALLNAVAGAGLATATATVVGFVIKGRTDKQANDIATKKLILEEDAARRVAGQAWRDELRADLKHAEDRSDRLQSDNDSLREELRKSKAEGQRRLILCERFGEPCQKQVEKD